MSLYKKYRPKTLDQVKGNDQMISSIQGMLKKKDKPQVFLFSGETGCGKTTLARILATEMGCSKADYKEINSGSFRGIDTARKLANDAQFKPMNGKIRVYLLDEAHKLTGDAQNGFLKTFEDTPPNSVFILCTTEPLKLIKAVRDRCIHYTVNLLKDDEMKGLLKKIVKKEKEEVKENVLNLIVEKSHGHPRAAIQLLETILSADPKNREKIAQQAEEEISQSIELCKALIYSKPWKAVSTILRGLKGQDAEGIRRHVLGYASSTLLNKDDGKLGLILEEFVEPFYNSGFPGLVYACYSVTKN